MCDPKSGYFKPIRCLPTKIITVASIYERWEYLECSWDKVYVVIIQDKWQSYQECECNYTNHGWKRSFIGVAWKVRYLLLTSQGFECNTLESHSLAKKKSSSRDGDSGARGSSQNQPSCGGEGNSGQGVNNKGGCSGGERDEARCHGKNK